MNYIKSEDLLKLPIYTGIIPIRKSLTGLRRTQTVCTGTFTPVSVSVDVNIDVKCFPSPIVTFYKFI